MDVAVFQLYLQKFYLQKPVVSWIWPRGHGLSTPAVKYLAGLLTFSQAFLSPTSLILPLLKIRKQWTTIAEIFWSATQKCDPGRGRRHFKSASWWPGPRQQATSLLHWNIWIQLLTQKVWLWSSMFYWMYNKMFLELLLKEVGVTLYLSLYNASHLTEYFELLNFEQRTVWGRCISLGTESVLLMDT